MGGQHPSESESTVPCGVHEDKSGFWNGVGGAEDVGDGKSEGWASSTAVWVTSFSSTAVWVTSFSCTIDLAVVFISSESISKPKKDPVGLKT